MDKKQRIIKAAEANRQIAFEAERYIWKHPQTGYTEWIANEYLIEKFEALGYKLIRADQDPKHGKIPGFYTDVDTGRPGPMLCIMGELDALDIANHPESVNGMCHSCGHNAQAATMLGLAATLKTDPSILDGLSGKIRLMLVPAEEMIQLAFRSNLIKEGTISYMGGKVEFLHRGYYDGVDLALMVHSGNLGDKYDFSCGQGNNGCMAKVITYKGKSSHAGGAPHEGINAQYAAMLGLQACNDLRETLQEKDTIRFHPIMKGVNCAVNIIPDEMVIESYVRGSNIEAMKRENKKFNRALAGAAAAIGCELHIDDKPGYSPEIHDVAYMQLVEEVCKDLAGADRVNFQYDSWSTGSSDFGDLTCVMPGIQFTSAGASGTAHGINYYLTDPERLLINSIKAQLLVADKLLKDDAAKAKEIVANYKAPYASIPEYLDAIGDFILDRDVVEYEENGNVKLNLAK